jgi:hypothetical protein
MSNQADPAADRRKKIRYKISPSFPLKVVIALSSESSRSSGGSWKDWPGTLVDLSNGGAHIQVNLAAVAFPENPCRIKFSLGSFKLDIPGTVAHFVCNARYAVCGVQFDFSNSGVERAYAHVLDPVMIGASFTPVDAETTKSGRHQEQFAGKNSAQLTVWRDSAGGELTGCELRVHRYVIETDRASGGDAGARPELRVRFTASEETAQPLTASQDEEARWLFRLAATSLSTSVPADVRKYLARLV